MKLKDVGIICLSTGTDAVDMAVRFARCLISFDLEEVRSEFIEHTSETGTCADFFKYLVEHNYIAFFDDDFCGDDLTWVGQTEESLMESRVLTDRKFNAFQWLEEENKK